MTLYCWELATKNESFYSDGEFEAASDEEAMDKARISLLIYRLTQNSISLEFTETLLV